MPDFRPDTRGRLLGTGTRRHTAATGNRSSVGERVPGIQIARGAPTSCCNPRDFQGAKTVAHGKCRRTPSDRLVVEVGGASALDVSVLTLADVMGCSDEGFAFFDKQPGLAVHEDGLLALVRPTDIPKVWKALQALRTRKGLGCHFRQH